MDVFGLNYTLAEDVNGPLLAVVLTLELIAALVTNTIVLAATLSQQKSLKLPSTILFTSLIMIHYVMAFIYILSWLISVISGGWIFGTSEEEKEATCNAAGFVVCYSLSVINATLTAISVDRWLFIVKPNFYKQYMKPKVTLVLVLSIWIFSGLTFITTFFGIGGFVFTTLGSCGPKFKDETGFTILLLAIFFPEISIVIVTSVWTYCFTKKFIREHAQLAENNVYVSKNRRLTGIFGLMLIAYVICYVPSLIPIILNQFHDVPAMWIAFGLVCILAMTFINPIIQSFFRREVKEEIKKFCNIIKCCPHRSNAIMAG
ncbi:PREDICTED: probable G-protein coupled receptor 52 [Amphimedon queenslandica]|uniref:G-protein coupled receptors family 1 profile domain-containing protein n=1 Tax=Amphimedon queenslandica TaxID=400682 RepID=A0A1X7TZ89_AMPQE|nr:PREDICTED: probable G-protein coupled receptor 52 [Amphimedon queenslandica]|eukprot:XP_011406445.1 PREDICTED: probable G-protein coupled receptor 52 [Amphimedon queenslandica]